jgi:hypothetical protein
MAHVANVITPGLISPDGYSFKLLRRQEYSRQANGVTIGKDFGTPIWTLQCTTIPMDRHDAAAFEVKLDMLEGVLGTFDAWDSRKPYPRYYPTGDFDDGAKIGSIGLQYKSISLYDLPSNFRISAGDYISFEANGWASLHRATQDATANESGVTGLFGVRPSLWYSVDVNTPVKLKMASTVMRMAPNSVTTQQVGGVLTTVSFSAFQVPPEA